MAFAPDFGLMMLESGATHEQKIHLVPFEMNHISVINENLFTSMSNMICEGEPHAVSLDFDRAILQRIYEIANDEIASQLKNELCENLHFGFTIRFSEPLVLAVTAQLGELQVAEKEEYIPLIVQEVRALAEEKNDF